MTKRQILILIGTAALFLLFDLGIYLTFTVRYRNAPGETDQSVSISAERYLPFEEGTLAVRIDTDFTLEGELPVLDGASALLPVYAGVVNSVYPEDSVSFDGEKFSPDSKMQYRNTKGAYTAVVDGTADIIFVAGPSEEQLAYAEEKGAELVFEPVGREAFVFVVNNKNPVDGLTSAQIRDIYSGGTRNWKDVGGESGPINAIQRTEGSGSQSALVRFMGDVPLKDNTGSPFGKCLGFSFRYYVTGLAGKPNLKMLAVDGVYPSAENIRSGEYPITSEFYAVYRKDNNNGNIQKVIKWLRSEEGRRLVEETGYVSL